jgi:hypothetical protein
MKIAVVTSVYGDYDAMTKPVFQRVRPGVEVEFVCVTDVWHSFPHKTWRYVTEPRGWLSPMMAAKVAKARPDFYTDADIMIWADGCIDITHNDFVEWMIDCLGTAQLATTECTCAPEEILDEARSSKAIPKYAMLPTVEQAEHYISLGYPPDWGSWFGGLIVWRRGLVQREIGNSWLAEMQRWGFQDQISLPYVLWRYRVRPANVAIPQYRFAYRGHKIQRCPVHLEPIGDGRVCIACDGGVF